MKEDLINGLTDSTLTENKIVNEYQAEKTIIASSPIEETKIETAPPKKVNDAANDEENVVSLPQKAESIPVKRKVSPIYFIVGAIAIVLVLFLIANNKSTKAPDMRNDISNSTIDPKVAFLLKNQNKAGVVTLPSGLQYEIKKDGKGPKPTQESEVKVYYHGTTIDGEVLDTGIDWPQPPSTFPVNRVISGWNEALQLMQVGSKWKLYIPAALAYGEKGYQDVKPNATVIYEVELIEIVQ